MKRFIIVCLILAGLTGRVNGYAAEDASTEDIKRVEIQIQRVLANQEKILAEIAHIKKELDIIKVRASVR